MRPEKKEAPKNLSDEDWVYIQGYNQACDEWENWLKSDEQLKEASDLYESGFEHGKRMEKERWEKWILESDLYSVILEAQEEIEGTGYNIHLLQSHRKRIAKSIKNHLLGKEE